MILRLSFNNIPAMLSYIFSCALLNYCNELFSNQAQILLMFIDSLCFLLMIILEDIIIFLTPYTNLKIINKNKKFTQTKIKRLKDHKTFGQKYQILILFALGIMCSLISSISVFMNYLFLSGFISSYCVFNILSAWIALRLWFKWKMHRHQFLGIVLIIIGFCFSLIDEEYFNIILTISFNDSYVFLIGSLIGIGVLISLREIIEKYMLDMLYYSQHCLLFYEGIVSLIIFCIVLGVIQALDCEEYYNNLTLRMFCKKSQISEFNDNVLDLFGYKSLSSLYVWLYIISTIVYNIFRLLLNKQQGPTQRYSLDFVAYSIYMIIMNLILGYQSHWVNWVVVAVLIIGCAIYNENLEVHLFGFAKNTKAEIKRRAKEDLALNELPFTEIIDVQENHFA